MKRKQWAQVKEIFGDALDRDPAQRERFIRNAASGDPDLLNELLRLLKESERESDLLSGPVLADVKTVMQDESPRFAPGAMLARRFRIVRFIARGGMGEVYEAEDVELGEPVALKVIRRRGGDAAGLRTLFKREVQLARRVTHPNVCRIFDLAQHNDNESGEPVLLLSMELIEGETLAEYLRRSGPLAHGAALHLIEDIAAGLQAIHVAGIVHGDLKPGNVMLTMRPGETLSHARVMDFGMAFPASYPAALPSSGGGPVGGTPDYLAPEQAKGAAATTATDIYAFALVITDILGVPRSERLAPTEQSIPARWVRILRQCLDRDPARRYPRPMDLVQALRSAIHHRSRMRRIVIVAVGALLSVLLAANRIDTILRSTANGLILTESLAETVECPSPDGRFLAGTEWDTGDLILREVATGKMRRLTHMNTSTDSRFGGVYSALFSPDGRRIAYMWANSRTENEIRIIGANGKGEQTLYRAPADAWPTLLDWSPDGSKILFNLGPPDSQWRLATLSVQDRSVQFLERPAAQTRVIFGADGGSLLFDARVPATGAWEVHRLLADGTESTLVGRTGSNNVVGWSPDRRLLIFSSDRRGQPGLWAVPVSERGAEGEPRELAADSNHWEPLGITRTGALFYRQDNSTVDVYTAVLDIAAGRTVSSPRRVTERFIGAYSAPNWSEDGRQLVFSSKREAPRPALAVYDDQTGEIRDLRPDLQWAGRPQWIEHDAAVIVMGKAQNGPAGLYRIDPHTGHSRLFRTANELQTGFEGAWSRDGKFHFNRFSDFRRGLFRLNLQTGDRRVLYIPRAGIAMGQENLALSPDGRMLAFHERDEAAGTSSLMLVPAEGGPATPLFTVRTPQAFRYGSFTWTSDSQFVLAASSRDVGNTRAERQISELWLVPVNGSPPRKIDFPAMQVLGLRLNPDDKTIAFHSRQEKSQIWVLQKFL